MLASKIFKLSDALEFSRTPGTVIIGQSVFGVETSVPDRDDPQFCELFGRRRRIHHKGLLGDFVASRVSSQGAELEAVCRSLQRDGREAFVEDLSLEARLRRLKRVRFVTTRLLPLLRNLAGHKAAVDPLSELDHLESLLPAFILPGETASSSLEQLGHSASTSVLGERVMVRGQNVFDLVWVGRQPDSPCHLQVEGERYIVKLRFHRTLNEVDLAFRSRFLQALRRRVASKLASLEAERTRVLLHDLDSIERRVRPGGVVYEDKERSVVWGGDGTFQCRQKIPPFVVECQDRKLRHFQSVSVAVRLDTEDPRRLLSDAGALVLGGYNHHFVFGGWGAQSRLCMGHNPAFYARFAQMPLEQGIVAYLDAARLVLCAGHYAGAPEGWMATDALGRGGKVISKKAARKAGLPIYRYYRG